MFEPKGIVPALVTPLDENGVVKEDSLRRLIDYTIGGGTPVAPIMPIHLEKREKLVDILKNLGVYNLLK